MTRYWLMKSEPDVYSIHDLEKEGSCFWEGVRNYQARNFMRDEMRVGDEVLFYHSNTKPPGIVGIARVCKEAYPDHTSWDPQAKYFDPKSDPQNPRWYMVDVEFVEAFSGTVSLQDLKIHEDLADMWVLRKGMRLSIQPVEKAHFTKIVKLGRAL